MQLTVSANASGIIFPCPCVTYITIGACSCLLTTMSLKVNSGQVTKSLLNLWHSSQRKSDGRVVVWDNITRSRFWISTRCAANRKGAYWCNRNSRWPEMTPTAPKSNSISKNVDEPLNHVRQSDDRSNAEQCANGNRVLNIIQQRISQSLAWFILHVMIVYHTVVPHLVTFTNASHPMSRDNWADTNVVSQHGDNNISAKNTGWILWFDDKYFHCIPGIFILLHFQNIPACILCIIQSSQNNQL